MKRLEQVATTFSRTESAARKDFLAHFQCAGDWGIFNQTLHVWLPSYCRFAAQVSTARGSGLVKVERNKKPNLVKRCLEYRLKSVL
ncbi:MAG: hypothetical protein ACRD63_01760 [Pyrinomonadaceae bacterium]